MPHGETIACLTKQMEKLKQRCKAEILRVAELQADDFNKDRQLWFDCRADRDRLCSDVRPGKGRIYQCLFKHKFDATMSEAVMTMNTLLFFTPVLYIRCSSSLFHGRFSMCARVV